MICEGCGGEVDELVAHHWPQFMSQGGAIKLGRFAEVCDRCNRNLCSLFPYIGDVPWGFQKKALLQYQAFVGYIPTLRRGSERYKAACALLREIDHGRCEDLRQDVYSWLTWSGFLPERGWLVDKVLEIESTLGEELLTSKGVNRECGGDAYHGPHTKRHEKQVEAFLKKVEEEEKVREWMGEHSEEVEKVRARHGLT